MKHKVAKEKSVMKAVEKGKREWLVKDVDKEVRRKKEARRRRGSEKMSSTSISSGTR